MQIDEVRHVTQGLTQVTHLLVFW